MDDGFGWLDRLDPDLRRRLWHLMDSVAEGHHAQVDAVVPELVALARESDQPWVEVFVRNFELRSLVLHRENTRAGMGKAIELLERAHRPDAVDCPQTICTAHAVCSGYGLRDPAGYVAERLAVSAETLARIDPRRVCWLCISNEHADAMIDDGRPDEALRFLDKQAGARLAAGAEVDPDDFGPRRAYAHLVAGRPEQALHEVQVAATDLRGESWQRTWRQWMARVLAQLGRTDEAAEHLSAVEDIIEDGGFRLHFDTLPLLYGGGAIADDELIRQACVLGRAAVARGVGPGVDALIWAVERLIDQGEAQLARAALEAAHDGLDVRRDAAATQAIFDGLAARIDALPARDPSAQPHDFESALTTLSATGDPRLAEGLAGTWHHFGFPERAEALVHAVRAQHPDDDTLFEMACQDALRRQDHAAFEQLLARPPATPDGPAIARWYAAQAHEAQGRSSKAQEILEALFIERAEWRDVAMRLGRLHLEAAAYDKAGAVFGEVAGRLDRPNAFDWYALAAATGRGDWATVRTLGRLVGFPLEPGDAPVETFLGLVRVVYPGSDDMLVAQRVSPVAARVESVGRPGTAQRLGDVVLLDPTVRNTDAMAADEDELPEHAVLAVLSEGNMHCVALDGAHPGAEAIDALRQALDDAGLRSHVGADDTYTVTHPTSGAELPGIYLLVTGTAEQLPTIRTHFAAVKGPGMRVWPELLAALGDAEGAQTHKAWAIEWGMI